MMFLPSANRDDTNSRVSERKRAIAVLRARRYPRPRGGKPRLALTDRPNESRSIVPRWRSARGIRSCRRSQRNGRTLGEQAAVETPSLLNERSASKRRSDNHTASPEADRPVRRGAGL